MTKTVGTFLEDKGRILMTVKDSRPGRFIIRERYKIYWIIKSTVALKIKVFFSRRSFKNLYDLRCVHRWFSCDEPTQARRVSGRNNVAINGDVIR